MALPKAGTFLIVLLFIAGCSAQNSSRTLSTDQPDQYHTFSVSYAVDAANGGGNGISWLCDGTWQSIPVKIPAKVKIYGGHIDGGISSLWADIYLWTSTGDIIADSHKLTSTLGWDQDHITDYFRAPYFIVAPDDTVFFAGWCGPALIPGTPSGGMVIFNVELYYGQ